MSDGKVVDHKETGIRYAIPEANFDDSVHDFVRDLKFGESVLAYQPRVKPTTKAAKAADGEEDLLGLPVTPDPATVPNTTPHLEAAAKSGNPKTK